MDEQLSNVQDKNSSYFIEWIPNNIKSAVCDIPPRGMKICATFLGNTTSLKEVLTRLCKSFAAMYSRKAYLHWYTGEGVEEKDFVEAESNVRELIKEFLSHEKAPVSSNSGNGDASDEDMDDD